MSKFLLIPTMLLFPLLALAACRQPAPSPAAPTPSRTSTLQPPPATPTTGAATEQAATPQNDTYLPYAPQPGEPTETLAPTPTVAPTFTPTPSLPPFPTYEGPPLNREAFGMQIHLHRENLDQIFNHLQGLGVGWVKVQVSWKLYETAPGEYDDWRFQELDHLVSGSASRDIKVLLSVAKAPEWSRSTTEFDGPPQDPARFQAFMRYLSARYQGNVAAYELWNEPNLQREWYGAPLDSGAFVQLVASGAAGVRAGDPQALIVAGAPATTGINDGVVAVDDRVYFRGMVAAGVADLVDALGVHPYGWANPPDASAANPDPVAPSHNNHPSFFFGDTIRDYRAILAQAGHEQLPLWLTEFGWGTFDGMGAPPPADAAFMTYVDEWQQAEYTLRAFEIAQEWGNVGPLFLWNLNFAPTIGVGFSESGYSVLRADGTPRPVYYSLQSAFTP